MFSRMLAIGIAPAPAPAQDVAAPVVDDATTPTATATAEKSEHVPWTVLRDRRLSVTTTAGTTSEGVFLGFEGEAVILEADDGRLIAIARPDVADVRTVKQSPPPPVAVAIPIPTDTSPLAFRGQRARVERQENERIVRVLNGTAIAGGVIASLSAVSSVVAEGFNVSRWSLGRPVCGETYDYSYYGAPSESGQALCGWTDGSGQDEFASYAYYENISGMTGASTTALPLHFGTLITLVPSTILRNRTGHRAGRKLHFAAWGLWGAGLASLTANQAVVWTQQLRTQQVCGDPEAPDTCEWITRTRGAPPGLYLLSAGLTLSSAILAIIDSRRVARSAERAASVRASPSIGVFPVSLQRGGGLGLAGKF
jgi:hypothetical protein